MIRGIGIDMTSVSEIMAISKRLSEGALTRMFTPKELTISRNVSNPAEYLATRFAAKEAVFKAIAHLLDEKQFDLRRVETLNRDDGSPYININDYMRDILSRVGVNSLFVSITTEGTLATAFIIAE